MSGESELPPGYRVCPYYATRSLRVLGLSQGNLIISVFMFGGLSFVMNPFLDLGLVGLFAYISERLTRNYPEGYVYYRLSTTLNSKFFAIFPGIRTWLADTWKYFGLTLPPAYKNKYEP